MRIRDIPLEERHEFGRMLYEARATPMPWHSACAWVLGCDDVSGSDAASLSMLAKIYAETAGKDWPPPAPRYWPREAKRRRDPFLVRERKKEIREDGIERGARFRAWRNRLGLSVRALSDLSGVSAASIRSNESGRDILAKVRLAVWKALTAHEASLRPKRDWLILTDQAS